MSETHWTPYEDHKPEDLHRKSVEYAISYGDEPPAVGFGEIHARKNPKGLVSLEVREEVRGPGECEKTQRIFAQTERTRFRIEPHPNPDAAVFRLSSYTLPPSSPHEAP